MAEAGFLRLALAVLAALFLGMVSSWSASSYAAVGLGVVLGTLLVVGRLRAILRGRLLLVLLDASLVTLLVVGTGGQDSPFFVLYFLTALELALVPGPVRSLIGGAVIVGGYLAATAVSAGDPGALASPTVGLWAGIIGLACGAAGLLGAKLRGERERGEDLSSVLASERSYGEEVEALASQLGPVLAVLGSDEILRWTAKAARESLGLPYAHVALLDGAHHQTSVRGDLEAYPSWWHPTIQKMVLWSCRTDAVHRSEENLHGVENFIAVPVTSADGHRMGAIVAGGASFGAEEERVLKLLAGQTAAALKSMNDAPGGKDPVSGLPNRASLRHVLKRELAREGPLTVMMLELDRFRRYGRAYGRTAGEDLLRAVGRSMKNSPYRMFSYEEDRFVAILRGSDESDAHEAALQARRIVGEATAGSAVPLAVSAGFATTELVDRNADSLIGAALGALGRSGSEPENVSGPPAHASYRDSETLEGVKFNVPGGRMALALAQTIELRAPYLGEHSRAVSLLSRYLGFRMGVTGEEMDALVIGALLHDIGKIGLPDSVLNKPGPLSGEEQGIIRQHPTLGAEMLGPIRELSAALPAVKHHHERFDGAGYPSGLRGKEIPLMARIVLAADAFDSMTRNRPYRIRLSERQALEEMARNAGTQFDPDVVEALVEMVEESDDWRMNSVG